MNFIKTAAGLCLLLVAQACTTGVGDIDRSQPGKLKKQALQGEWYYRQTVVDVPFTGGMTFVGEQSTTERIHFEISEDLLTAYRSYEKVEGSEIPSQPSDETYQGAPIAAFRIKSHFDVLRNYNDATGEQSNVISENTTDRPWYEREYIRVDWSHNLLANFDESNGGLPQPQEEPTGEQLSALAEVLRGDAAPYCDFAVWGPYGRRQARMLRFTAQVWVGGGACHQATGRPHQLERLAVLLARVPHQHAHSQGVSPRPPR